jgi:hypothetical protein
VVLIVREHEVASLSQSIRVDPIINYILVPRGISIKVSTQENFPYSYMLTLLHTGVAPELRRALN